MKENELEDKIESLEIQLKHLKNDYNLTKGEKEKSIKRYLEILFDLQERNKELQNLQKNLEKIVEERTEELKKSEEKYRSLFNNMLNGLAYCKMFFDENNKPIDFIYLDVNDSFERLTGFKKENVLGKKVTEAIPGIKDTHSELIDIYGKVALTGEPTEFEIDFEPLKIWLNISVYSPKKEHFVAVFDNITERKKLEEERIKASKLEGIHNLVVTVNHEMNQPLSVITSYSEHLIEELEKGSQAYEDAQMINDAAWRLAELVKRIAELRKAEEITFTEYSKGIDMVDLRDTNEGENE